MNEVLFNLLCLAAVLGVVAGLVMMSKVRWAARGNIISALSILLAIILILAYNDLLMAWDLWLCLIAGSALGLVIAFKVKMIQMPQLVALLCSFGGASCSIVVAVALVEKHTVSLFDQATAAISLAIGVVSLVGALIAAGKLAGKIPARPIILPAHSLLTIVTLGATLILTAVLGFFDSDPLLFTWLVAIMSALFGLVFVVRVGGADMPITISFLISIGSVAGAVAGMAVGQVMLVALEGIVGASGLLLTQIMCRAMNRSLMDILLGKTSVTGKTAAPAAEPASDTVTPVVPDRLDLGAALREARDVILIPGYGMALAQAQSLVKDLTLRLEEKGARVRFAIHPVAGRMPGHMNVLLAEVDIPYDQLYEMETINDDFPGCDLAIIIGANDVVNPAARTAENTPIYGMPVLNADQARCAVVCNFDDKPGYSGVPNPLYAADNVILKFGDAKATLKEMLTLLTGEGSLAPVAAPAAPTGPDLGEKLREAREVIVIPGYGMALAQAQSLVKDLTQRLEEKGARVRFAIHPVAGRMPGHMNVLLAEVDIPYDQLYEMETINDDFPACDLAIIIGANDVVNPAARTAENTPIYGMPVLNADQAKCTVVCNFDDKPGYSGVPNPLYEADNVILRFGDAKATLKEMLSLLL